MLFGISHDLWVLLILQYFGITFIISGIYGLKKKRIDPSRLATSFMFWPLGLLAIVFRFIMHYKVDSIERGKDAVLASYAVICFGIFLTVPTALFLLGSILPRGLLYRYAEVLQYLIPVIMMSMIIFLIVQIGIRSADPPKKSN